MFIKLLKSKIGNARVVLKDLYGCGSIAVDMKGMKKAGMYEYEHVHVLNINNGNRLETYAIAADFDYLGNVDYVPVKLMGAAARLAEIGDDLIILSYGYVKEPLKGVYPCGVGA